MTNAQLKKIIKIFKKYPQIKLVYFFGSRAKNKAKETSDYDFAFYLEEENKKERFNLRIILIKELIDALSTNQIDVLILNDLEMPELKFQIISKGKLIYEKEPYRVLIEPKIMTEYFDFSLSLSKYNLTRND